jgi:type IV secretion system protein VirB6
MKLGKGNHFFVLIVMMFISAFLVCTTPSNTYATQTYPKSKTINLSSGTTPTTGVQMATPAAPGTLGVITSADSDGKMTCIGATSLLARIVYDVMTIGIYEAARASVSMTDTGTCGNTDPTLTFKVYHYVFPGFEWVTYNESSGDSLWFLLPPLVMHVETVSDKLCLQLWMPLLSYQNIGCKYTSDPSNTTVAAPCFVSETCSGQNSLTQSPFNLTTSIIECLNNTIKTIFTANPNCSDSTGALTNFSSFRDQMRTIVRMLLVIYIIFFGFKISLGGEIPPAGEVLMFGMKMILVLYFSVGLPSASSPGGYQDGVQTFLYPFFSQASSDLADMMYEAGGARGLCAYGTDNVQYASGGSYLALWNSIDCRFAYYMGLSYMNGLLTAAWELILGGVFAFQVIFVIVLIIFLVFFVSIIVHFTHVFILSMISIALLIYMAPLFVPCALFNQTKGFYDAWLKQIISYTLQPMILASFIALMLTVFDTQVFGTCTFTTGSLPKTSWVQFIVGYDDLASYKGFEIDSTNADNANSSCTSTMGYAFLSGVSMLSSKNLFFFTIPVIVSDFVDQFLPGLLTLVLFGFLFHALAGQVGMIAGDLTGGAPLAKMAVGATAVFDKAAGMAKAVAKNAMGDTKGAAEEAKKAAGDDKGGDKGGDKSASVSGDSGGGGGGGGGGSK